MTGFAKSLASFLLLAFSLVAPVGAAQADPGKTIFYNLTSDDAWRAGMALGQANKALDNGYKVVVFLNVRGVYVGSKRAMHDIAAVPNKSTQQLLKGAMKKGAVVIACPMCMKRAGLSMDDILPGILKGGADTTMKYLTADNTAVLSY